MLGIPDIGRFLWILLRRGEILFRIARRLYEYELGASAESQIEVLGRVVMMLRNRRPTSFSPWLVVMLLPYVLMINFSTSAVFALKLGSKPKCTCFSNR